MSRLATLASQLGLANLDEAERALTIGARMLAHGFTDREIDEMIVGFYAKKVQS